MRKAAALTAAGILFWPFSSMARPADGDHLTVSGRFGLPSGAGSSLQNRLAVSKIDIDAEAARQLGGKASVLQPILRQAIEKSLRNHAYFASDPASAIPVTVVIAAAELTKESDGMRAIAHIRFDAPEPTGGACLPYLAQGKFHSLNPVDVGATNRALGVAMAIGMAAVGYNSTLFTTDQFKLGAERSAVLNMQRPVGEDEGVAPPGGAQAVEQFAVEQATLRAFIDLLRHLGEPGGCNAAIVTKTFGQSPAQAIQPTMVAGSH